MSKQVVFVIGATGSVGSATIKILSAKYAERVEIRAGVRNPDKAEQLKSLVGVTVVKAEMGSAELETTLRGVHTLFIVTPPVENLAELVTATATSAKKAGVKHVVTISGVGADKPTTPVEREFAKLESGIKALGIAYTFLHLPYFIDNYWAFKDTIKSAGVINNPTDPSKPFLSVIVADIGRAAAAILVDPAKHAGKTYYIISDRHCYGDIATAFGEALGKAVTYNRVSYTETRDGVLAMGVSKRLVEILVNFFQRIDAEDDRVCGTTDGAYQDYQTITGEQPTNLKTWVAQVKDAFE